MTCVDELLRGWKRICSSSWMRIVDESDFDHFHFLAIQFRWESCWLTKRQVKLADDHHQGGEDRTEVVPRVMLGHLIFLLFRRFLSNQYHRSFSLIFIDQKQFVRTYIYIARERRKHSLSLSLDSTRRSINRMRERRESWQMILMNTQHETTSLCPTSVRSGRERKSHMFSYIGHF